MSSEDVRAALTAAQQQRDQQQNPIGQQTPAQRLEAALTRASEHRPRTTKEP